MFSALGGPGDVRKMEESFLRAYDEYTDQLFRHCLIRLRDREAAKDIVQETFARTWVYIADRNEVQSMRAFLYRVANNLIVDLSRKKKTTSLDALMDDDGFEPEAPAEYQLDPISLEKAIRLLETLDDAYRTVVTMRFVDDLTPKEIAGILGISENAVSVRIHRGISRLSKIMKARE